MLRTLSRFRSLRRAFGRPLALLRAQWGIVTLGCLFVPVHAAVSLWMPRLLGNALARYHERRVSHARRLRPSAWLFVYATLLCARCE